MSEGVETRIVYGFLDAGKTHYICDSIRNDYFHKYGSTLILCFEQGEEEYDAEALADRRTSVAYYDGEEDVCAFCRRSIEDKQPDRIYVEMNIMMQDLRGQFPDRMNVTFAVTLIDWATMPVYYANFRQMIRQMVADSMQVTFRGCPSKELLEPYSQSFRLMNQKASYLRQDPMGYHERAFDRFLPFSLEPAEIEITGENYLPFWLDAFDHPEHYEGKKLRFSDPVEVRCKENDAAEAVQPEEAVTREAVQPDAADDGREWRSGAAGPWSVGRVVMVCCMADLQFMSFELEDVAGKLDRGWIRLDAEAVIGSGGYGRKQLKLRLVQAQCSAPPEKLILGADRRLPSDLK